MDRNDYLTHHGILGQKWGVRRYQNYDGSYTRQGMKRYKQSESRYNDAKEKLKNAKSSGNKSDIESAKRELKYASRELNRDYKQLEKDRRADEGKNLYQEGKTIRDINSRTLIAGMATSAVTTLINMGLSKSGVEYVGKYGNVPIGNILQKPIAAIGTAANIGIAAKGYSDKKKLRAYYAHSRRRDD